MRRICTFMMIVLAMMTTAVMPCFGQSQAPADSTNTPRINRREARQQRRIEQGVASGQLTPRETQHLERQQARIQNDVAMAKADGKVTPQERAKITREQNRASRDIYRKKHNDRVAK